MRLPDSLGATPHLVITPQDGPAWSTQVSRLSKHSFKGIQFTWKTPKGRARDAFEDFERFAHPRCRESLATGAR
jgi:hypothetical protein